MDFVNMYQLPLIKPPTLWTPPSLSDLPSWAGVKRVGVDCETHDPQLRKLGIGVRRDGYIAGVSFTLEDSGQSFYLPVRHAGGGNLPVDSVFTYLKEQAKHFDGQVVGANFQYDLDYLMQEGVEFPKVKFFRDVQIAAPLIDENQDSFSLFSIGQRLGIESKNEDLLREAALAYKIDPKKEMWKLPAGYVGAYAEHDSASPLAILRAQEKEFEKQNLWDIWNLESRVLPVLVKMRRRGVLIDQDKLTKVEAYSREEAAKALRRVKDLTGVTIDPLEIMNNKKLVPAFVALGIKVGTTKTGKPNIDQVFLENTGELGQLINWARKVSKLRTTFAASVREHMVDGRIHCTFNQIAREDDEGSDDVQGARYGRLSCVKPNLQQQPSRDEFANFWRSIYIPEEGMIWGCNDYSQQEPRWTTHFAALMNLSKAREVAQRYWDDPNTDNHTMMTELIHGKDVVAAMSKQEFKDKRSIAKDNFLGVCYGEGGAKLCREFGLPTRWAMRSRAFREIQYYGNRQDALDAKFKAGGEGFVWEAAGEEGQRILDAFDTNVPFVRQLARAAENKVKKSGVIRTVGGRMLHFPQRPDGSFDWTHKALNRLIQGSSADQTKLAMVAIDEHMPNAFIQLQVHDEIDGSFPDIATAKAVGEIMRTCIPDTQVPFKIDTEVGANWGEMKSV